MTAAQRLSVLATALSCTLAAPLAAQTSETAQELAEMRAQLEALTQRIDELESELDEANARLAATSDDPAPATHDRENTDTAVAWKGAPEISGENGWSFKPRGRIQVDAGAISSPAGVADDSTGFGSEVRRAYLGVEGKMPGGIGYRAEVDLADNEVEITDLYLTYSPSKSLTLLVGQTKPFWSLEELTSDLFTSFTERAAFTSAFGFERRLGLSGTWSSGPVLAQAGVFTDNIGDLSDDENNALSYDARLVFMPKLAGGQAHFGGSFHHRELNDSASSVRYRARPFIHTPDIRFIDTGSIDALSETGYGLETAFIRGPFHTVGEAHWQSVDRIAGAEPTFFGGYAEVGYFLTGETREYRNGSFDRTAPARPVGDGGFGALQINLRYDHLDLIDAGVIGGLQDTYGIALVWIPTAYTKLMANYGHIVYDRAAIITGAGDRDYTVDAFGVRAQVDF